MYRNIMLTVDDFKRSGLSLVAFKFSTYRFLLDTGGSILCEMISKYLESSLGLSDVYYENSLEDVNTTYFFVNLGDIKVGLCYILMQDILGSVRESGDRLSSYDFKFYHPSGYYSEDMHLVFG